MKKVVRINESQLRRIVTETIKKAINETSPERAAALGRGRRAQASGERGISQAQKRLGTTSDQFTDKANAAGNKAADLWNQEYGVGKPGDDYGRYMVHNNGNYSVDTYSNYSNADGRKTSIFSKYDPQTDMHTSHTKVMPSDSEKSYYGPESPFGRDDEWDNEIPNYVKSGGGYEGHKVARRMASNDRNLPYLNEKQLKQIVTESVKRVLNEITTNELNGRTFIEWCKEVKQDLLKNGYTEMSNDNGFVKRIAAFTWESVEDGEADDLETSLSGMYYEIEDEYWNYYKKGL